MTELTKPVRRVTAQTYRKRRLCVELRPLYLEIWEKGRRDHLAVSYDAIYELALKKRWLHERAEKKAAQKAAKRKV